MRFDQAVDRAAFEAEVAALEPRLSGLSRERAVVELMGIAALPGTGTGHTGIPPFQRPLDRGFYPLYPWLFADGVWITLAGGGAEAAWGRRSWRSAAARWARSWSRWRRFCRRTTRWAGKPSWEPPCRFPRCSRPWVWWATTGWPSSPSGTTTASRSPCGSSRSASPRGPACAGARRSRRGWSPPLRRTRGRGRAPTGSSTVPRAGCSTSRSTRPATGTARPSPSSPSGWAGRPRSTRSSDGLTLDWRGVVETVPRVGEEFRLPIDLVREGRLEEGIAAYRSLAADGHVPDSRTEMELNRTGYALLEAERPDDAVAVFRLQAELYPEVANSFDSLGDGYRRAGDLERAAEAYRRSLEVDPGFRHSRRMLEEIGAGGSPP